MILFHQQEGTGSKDQVELLVATQNVNFLHNL